MQRTRSAVFTLGLTGPVTLFATAPTQPGILPDLGGLSIRFAHGHAPMADVEEFDSVIPRHFVALGKVNVATTRCASVGGA